MKKIFTFTLVLLAVSSFAFAGKSRIWLGRSAPSDTGGVYEVGE